MNVYDVPAEGKKIYKYCRFWSNCRAGARSEVTIIVAEPEPNCDSTLASNLNMFNVLGFNFEHILEK
jgi:hypothetical protein